MAVQRLHAFAGYTDESRSIANVSLYSMTNKVKAGCQVFSTDHFISNVYLSTPRCFSLSLFCLHLLKLEHGDTGAAAAIATTTAGDALSCRPTVRCCFSICSSSLLFALHPDVAVLMVC